MPQSKLTAAIAEALEISPAEITSDANSTNLEAWDSLKHLDVILKVEQMYAVKFKTAEIAELVSVTSLEEALRQRNVL
jgi:acyl carrier protein